MAIWITQFLCPARHAAFAIPWDDTTTTAEAMAAEGEHLRVALGLNAHCGICGEPIAPEAGRTLFGSLADAVVAMQRSQADQLASRHAMDRLGLTRERLDQDLTLDGQVVRCHQEDTRP